MTIDSKFKYLNVAAPLARPAVVVPSPEDAEMPPSDEDFQALVTAQ